MPKNVVFDWGTSIEIDNVIYCPDHLDRARYAQFLTEFLNHQDQKKPFVLNLNSGWGTGKTYFLKRWTEELRKNHPVVYIDAWRDDRSDDPFMTVISSIISQLRSETSYPEESAFVKGVSKGISLFKAMGPLFLGAAAKKYFGKDLSELASIFDGNSAEPSKGVEDATTSTDLSKDVGDAATKMAQFLILSHDQKNESVKALKISVTNWIKSVIGHNPKITGPTFVIIDELDRCRPSYAVETLEAVKHIFDIAGVFFIIATDTEQLQHAIKVVYGSGFDAQTYLSRFFDSRFSLRETSLADFIEAHCQVDVFTNEYAKNNQIRLWPVCESPLGNIITILDSFKLQPRSAIQIVNKIASAVMFLKKGDIVDLVYLTILHCLHMSDQEAYNKIMGRAYLGDIDTFFKGKDYFVSELKIKVMENISSGRNVIDVSLNLYFKLILSFNSKVFTQTSDCVEIKTLNTNKIEEFISGDCRKRNVSILSGGYAVQILQYEYIEHQLRKKEKIYYKDLVELSASFD